MDYYDAMFSYLSAFMFCLCLISIGFILASIPLVGFMYASIVFGIIALILFFMSFKAPGYLSPVYRAMFLITLALTLLSIPIEGPLGVSIPRVTVVSLSVPAVVVFSLAALYTLRHVFGSSLGVAPVPIQPTIDS
jgi:hypothetical protein